MNVSNYQTHISFKLDTYERMSSFGMKMLKQLNNRSILDIALIKQNGSNRLICRTEGLESINAIDRLLTIDSRKDLIARLAQLIGMFEENAFLNKEFIVLDPDKVFINPEDGSARFIVLPVVSNATGALGREWLEKLYEYLETVVYSVEAGTDASIDRLRDILINLGDDRTDSGELAINGLIALCRYIVENYAGAAKEMQPKVVMPKSSNIAVGLNYHGRYGNFSLYIIKKEFLIGKSESCDGRIPFNNAISRQHGMVYIENGECFYEDLGSSNYSRLNGAVLEPHRRIKLNNEDILMLADMEFKVEILESAG